MHTITGTYGENKHLIFGCDDFFEEGSILYVKTNHLGNVLVTVTDRRNPIESQTTSGEIAYYEADIASAQDYFPFGMIMPGRSFSTGEYRYGFNGMERDDELKGTGNSYDFGARIYDSRLGRWLSLDPSAANYPSWSDYNFTMNNPVFFIDPDGKDPREANIEVSIDFRRFRVINAEDTRSFSSELRDFDLHAKSVAIEFLQDRLVFGSNWLKLAWRYLDSEVDEFYNALGDFMHAAHSESYSLREFDGTTFRNITTMIDREIKDWGVEGFEAEVWQKTEYDVSFSRGSGSEINMDLSIKSKTFYTLVPNSNNEGNDGEYKWKVETFEYNSEGEITNSNTRYEDAIPREN